jgi:salicylate hydroxylase
VRFEEQVEEQEKFMTNSPSQDTPVLIAGGGIGGLAIALALALKGIPSRVLEQASQFGEIGAGIQLGPNVFRMFERLGILEQVSSTAVFVDDLIMMDSLSGEVVTKVRLGESIRKRFGQPYAVIHRADLHTAFLEACQANDLITLETSKKVVSFEERGDGVRLHTEDGTNYDGAALIGCDGLWSKVRALLLGDEPPRVSGHIAYRAVLPIEEVPEDLRWNAATLWAGPRNHLVHYPLRNWKLFNLVAVFHSDKYVEGWNTTGDRDLLMERFQGVDPRPMSLLEKISDWRMWVLCDREPIKVWSKRRVTLLGDAAHPMLQYFAQGACMATEDAVCLADKIMEAKGDYAAAFEAYQSERYLRTGRVQYMARFLGDIYHSAGVHRELRNMMLGARDPEDHEGLAWLYGGP